MSGATITGNGIMGYINDGFRTYNKYFDKIRSN